MTPRSIEYQRGWREGMTHETPLKTHAVERDCPHAAPFRYCETCKAEPCPIGLGGNVGLSLIDKIAIKLSYHRMIGSTFGVTARAVLEVSHHAELVKAVRVSAQAFRTLEEIAVAQLEHDKARNFIKLGDRCRSVLAKIGGDK